jgi:hypothetical protein
VYYHLLKKDYAPWSEFVISRRLRWTMQGMYTKVFWGILLGKSICKNKKKTGDNSKSHLRKIGCEDER